MVFITVVNANLGKDPEIKNSGTDKQFVTFSAAGRVYAGKSDKGSEYKTLWFDCVAFGKLGERISKFAKKGTSATIMGELDTREHEGKTYLKITVDKFELGARSGAKSETTQEAGAEAAATTSAVASEQPSKGVSDADVPF